MKNIFLTHYIRVVYLFLFGFIFLTVACQKDDPPKKKEETPKVEKLHGNWELILLTSIGINNKKDTIYHKKNHSSVQMYSDKVLISFEKSEVLKMKIDFNKEEMKEHENTKVSGPKLYKDGAELNYHLNGNTLLFDFKAEEKNILWSSPLSDIVYEGFIDKMTLRTFWADVRLISQGGRTYLEALSSQGNVIKFVKID